MKRFVVLLLGVVLVGVVVGVGAFVYLDEVVLESRKVEDYFVAKEGVFNRINQTNWELADLDGYFLLSYRWGGARYFLIAIRNQKLIPVLVPIFVEGKLNNEDFSMLPFVDLKTGSRLEDYQQVRQAIQFGEKIRFVLLVSVPSFSEDGVMLDGQNMCDADNIHKRLCAIGRLVHSWDSQVKDWYLAKGLRNTPRVMAIGGSIEE